jgi:SAM-dependent methyltransferase
LRQAAGRYRRLPRFYRCYAAAKYRRDPVYRLLAARLEGAERVVDLGCGIGLLPVLLSLMPGRRQVTGVEWDGRKLEMARQATSGLTAVTLVEADIRAVAIPEADAIVFADVLHYFDLEIQERLLRAASAALLPGGQLLVRETDACAQRGARLTRLVESMAVRLGWNRGLGIHFRAAGELAADLRRLGLDVERVEAAGSGLAGNWLLCARQPVEKSSGCQALAERAQADG